MTLLEAFLAQSPVALALAILASLLGLVSVLSSIVIVKQGTVALVERFGRYVRTLEAGLHFLTPLIEETRRVRWTCALENPYDKASTRAFKLIHDQRRVDVCEQQLDLVPFKMLTVDRLEVSVNCVIYFRVIDAMKAVYSIDNLYGAIASLVETALRAAVCKLKLDETVGGIDAVRAAVTEAVREQEAAWGFSMTRFDLQSIDASRAIVQGSEESIVKARKAEAELRALEAQREAKLCAQRTETELRIAQANADAEESALKLKILESEEEGRATRSRTRARAEADTHRMMREAGATDEFLVRQLDAEAWRQVCTHSRAVVVPYEAARFLGFGGALGGVAKVMQEFANDAA